MFARLWFHGFIGCNHQQNRLDASRAGQHVADKPLMARNINKTEALPVRQCQVGKAEIDGNSPSFFFR